MADVELGQPLPVAASLITREAASIRMLVRLHGHPIGMIDLAATALADIDLRTLVWARCSGEIKGHLARYHAASAQAIPERGFPDEDPSLCSWRAVLDGHRPAAPSSSTCAPSERWRWRPQALRDFQARVSSIVDNRPATSGVGEWLGKGLARRRHVAPAAWTGKARGAGLAAATTNIVAFTDDDVVLDPSWLGWMVAGFAAAERVACVTGLIVPLELETQAQVLMEEFSGFGKGFEQRIWDRDEHRLAHPLYPYTVGLFGSGASAAFSKDVLASLGGFDPHLGIGTPAIGAGIDIYTRLVLGGHQIVYRSRRRC
jgi:hypothetical protein